MPAGQPSSSHATRTSSSSKSCARSASPRYWQYSSRASVGTSRRPSSAMARCPLTFGYSFFDEKVPDSVSPFPDRRICESVPSVCSQCYRLTQLRSNRNFRVESRSFFYKEGADNQRIHARAEESTHRVRRRVHDGFAAQIEGCIHEDRHAGAFVKFVDYAPVEGVDLFLHSLRPCASVNVSDGGDHAALFLADLRCQNHERRIRNALEIIASGLLLERRCKRSPPLTKFHRVIYLGVHFRISRIGEDRTAA